MKKENIIKLWIMVLLVVSVVACDKEGSLVGDYTYNGPIPAITKGVTPAEQLCYELFQKYDMHIYCTLAGDDALRTEVGTVQTNPIFDNNPAALPMQPADAVTAEKFLKILKTFYALLPDEVVKFGLYKRQVLVKINPANNKQTDTDDNLFYTNIFTEDQQGILYYGDLDDAVPVNLKGWKNSICEAFFGGLATFHFKKIPFPEAFGAVSDGFYRNDGEDGQNMYLCFDKKGKFMVTEGLKYGFLHPDGAKAWKGWAYADFASYAAWMLTTAMDEQQVILKNYPLVKVKYELVLQYYKDMFKLDLLELAPKILAITAD